MQDSDRVQGEEAIVQEFLAPLAAGHAGALGLQDDCALLTPTPGTQLVLKTDPVLAGVHFLADADPADIAWRALAVNVSDLAAKGALPIAYLMALALPEAPRRDWMARFAAGLGAAQQAFGCHLIGGDTDLTRGPLTISITAIGELPAGQMVRRAAARVGDSVLVTGTLGDAALGLKMLRDPGLISRHGLTAHEADGLVARFRRPTPRLSIGALLRGQAHAAMDVSDGLVKDLTRMARASGVGARIDVAALPLSPAARMLGRSAVIEALSGGDDYEILLTAAADAVPAIVSAAAAVGCSMTRIGLITDQLGVVQITDSDGSLLVLDRTGWDHF